MSKRETYTSDFPGLDPAHMRGMTVAPREARPTYTPPPAPTPKGVTVVEHHVATIACRIRRDHLAFTDPRLTFYCRAHAVLWRVPRCNVLSDKGARCRNATLSDQTVCKFHDHMRVVCDDCGHNVVIREDGDRTRRLHRDDHRFAPDEDGRFCADCNLPGRMLDDGRIVHHWDHSPRPVDLPWETVDDDAPASTD